MKMTIVSFMIKMGSNSYYDEWEGDYAQGTGEYEKVRRLISNPDTDKIPNDLYADHSAAWLYFRFRNHYDHNFFGDVGRIYGCSNIVE